MVKNVAFALWLFMAMGYSRIRNTVKQIGGGSYTNRRISSGGQEGDRVVFQWKPAQPALPASNATTLDGSTVDACAVYRAADADLTEFVADVGTDLPSALSGTAQVVGLESLLADAEKVVSFSGSGKVYGGAGLVTEPGTDDVRLSFLFRGHGSTVAYVFGAYSGSYQFCAEQASSGVITFSYGDGTTVATATATGVYSAWNYCDVLIKHGDKMQVSCNGVQGTAVDISAIGSIGFNSSPFYVGTCGSQAVEPVDIAFLSITKKASWLTSVTQADFIAEQFAKLNGTCAAKVGAPSLTTRSTAGNVSKWIAGKRYDFRVGPDWPRVRRGLDGVLGAQMEIAGANQFLYTDDISNAAWVKYNLDTAPTRDATVIGTNQQGMFKIIGDNSAAIHGIEQSGTNGDPNHVFKAIVHAGDGARKWACLYTTNAGGGRAYFDLENGVVGAISGFASNHGIKDFGDGVYEIWVHYSVAAVGNHDHYVLASDGDGGEVFTGDGTTIDLYVQSGHHESDNDFHQPTSEIYAEGAASTRAADRLQYTGLPSMANYQRGRVEVVFEGLLPNVASGRYFFELSDPLTAVDYKRLYHYIGAQARLYFSARSTAEGAAISSFFYPSTATDQGLHTIVASWDGAVNTPYEDGVAGLTSTLTSGVQPDALSALDIACSSAGAAQPNAIIRSITIYARPTA